MDVLDGIANLPSQLLLIKLHLHQERVFNQKQFDAVVCTSPGYITACFCTKVPCQYHHVTDEMLAQVLDTECSHKASTVSTDILDKYE